MYHTTTHDKMLIFLLSSGMFPLVLTDRILRITWPRPDSLIPG